jgi:hypothetical protein
MGRVFRIVRPFASVRFRVEPYAESAREFEPVANTNRNEQSNSPLRIDVYLLNWLTKCSNLASNDFQNAESHQVT